MRNVHFFFLKLFGCMLCEAKANGHEVPIDIAPFSQAIMSDRAHPEVHLQFGKCDGTRGRSNLHCWTTQHGSVLAGWLYEIDTIAVSVLFVQAGHWEHRPDLWHPESKTSSKRFQIADFMYSSRAARTRTRRNRGRRSALPFRSRSIVADQLPATKQDAISPIWSVGSSCPNWAAQLSDSTGQLLVFRFCRGNCRDALFDRM
jgi:hypothetical protein